MNYDHINQITEDDDMEVVDLRPVIVEKKSTVLNRCFYVCVGVCSTLLAMMICWIFIFGLTNLFRI